MRLAIPVAALMTALSGSAALATPTAGHASPATASSTFTWHAFTLQNGWKTAGTKKLITGHPGWTSHNGVVYLRGAVKHTGTGISSQFATLPKGDRPARNLYIQIWTQGDQPGTLYIGANGVLDAYRGSAKTFASLANVSFPTAAIKEHKLTLANGWVSSQADFNTGDPSYAVSHGVVYLTGSLSGGNADTTGFTLPTAARPAHNVYLSAYTFEGGTGTLEFSPNGQVRIFGSAATDYTSLANISYPAPGAQWHSFKLTGGWKSAQPVYGSGEPAYTVIDGVRYLGGSLISQSATNGLWTDLPTATRSPNVLEIEVDTFGGSTGSIGITSAFGLVSSNPFSHAQEFASLAGIEYPPGA